MVYTETKLADLAETAQAALPKNETLYHSIQDAIQQSDFAEAHRLLLSLVEAEADNAHNWLLLAWTAPTYSAARRCFERALALEPGHPLALDGLSWSETDWAFRRNGHDPAAEQGAAATIPISGEPPMTMTTPGANLPTLETGLAAEAAPGGQSLPTSDRFVSPALAPQPLALRLRRLGYGAYLVLYLLGIAAAEAVTAWLNPQLGLLMHGGLLVLIFLHASLGALPAGQKFLYTLALAPLIRLMSLSIPLLQFQFTYWYMIIGAPLFLSAVIVLRLTGYKPRQVGLALGNDLPLQTGVAVTGLGLGYMEYLILRPQPLAASLSLADIWLPALILLVFTGFLEEFIFRGLMQRAALVAIPKLGPLYISLLFAVLHIGYRSVTDFVFVFLVGWFFSLVAVRTRSILGVSLAHGLTNITLFLVFPFVTLP